MTEQNEKSFLDIVKGVTEIADDLELSKKEKVELYRKVLDKFNIPSSFLDVALEEKEEDREVKDSYELLELLGYTISHEDFLTKLIIKGYLQIGYIDDNGRLYGILTKKGKAYGIETAEDYEIPLFYTDKFDELCSKVLENE